MPKRPNPAPSTGGPSSGNPEFHRRGSIVAITDPRLPQTSPWEVTSIVWSGASGRAARAHPGHAAFCMRRTMHENPDFADLHFFRYVSFIPGMSANTHGVRPGRFTPSYAFDIEFELGRAEERLQTREFSPTPGQVVVGHKSAGYEYGGEEVYTEKWAKIADQFTSMPAQNLSNWGIHMNKIVEWVDNFWQSEDCYYDFISNTNNCAGVVWRALTSGGGKAFAEIHANCPNHRVYTTPSDFHEFSTYASLGIQKINQASTYVSHTYNATATARDVMAGAPVGWSSTDLYRPADWMRESSVAWKTRGLILRRIDACLEKYHSLTWGGNYNDKLLEVLKIIIALQEHFLVSKSGKRDAALCALAKQVFSLKTQLDAEAVQMWDLSDYYGVALNDRAVARTGSRPLMQRMADRFSR